MVKRVGKNKYTMPTILLRTAIPDYPNNGQEICHLFSANYLLSRANGVVNYKMPQNGVDSINFLFNVIHRFNLQRTNGPIQPGDLIIIGNRNMNANANTAIANVTHSMIAIDNNIWFGCNNTNTFGLYFATHYIYNIIQI